MLVKGSPVIKTKEGLLQGDRFDGAQSFESQPLSSSPNYEKLSGRGQSPVDTIGQLRANLARLEQLQSKMLFMMDEVQALTVRLGRD